MQQAMTRPAAPNVLTGSDASRARRLAMSQGKRALPQKSERTRNGLRSAVSGAGAAPAAPQAVPAAPASVKAAAPAAASAGASAPVRSVKGSVDGRELSIARRRALVEGKGGLVNWQSGADAVSAVAVSAPAPQGDGSCHETARALRAERARRGRGNAAPARPTRPPREKQQLNYPPKVAGSSTYQQVRLTGVRIGRGTNVTGDEPGSALPVTGTQYIGTESGYAPRAGGPKVGAARTGAGLVVTGSQVRSGVSITGDESNAGIRITGEADQEIADDLIAREGTAASSAQFQRQNNPHGHSVFGANLGRSIKSIGSRERDRSRAIEQTDGGQPISGTAVGRSARITGDEAGSCRPITGDQYLMPATRQPLCDGSAAMAPAARMASAIGRIDPVTGEKVTVSEAWSRQYVTGVKVEQDTRVTGDEYGTCSAVTGTPYVGPAQYETFCKDEAARAAEGRVAPGMSVAKRITGDTPLSVNHVTGTQRGSERSITGTPYYREDAVETTVDNPIEQIARGFSVHSPQREAHLRTAVAEGGRSPAGSRITGSFAVGDGKITGNQEFHFAPRATTREPGRLKLTGEGRSSGLAITGYAWSEHKHVTGTEGRYAVDRNPSERAGNPQRFAGSAYFSDKGKHEPSKQMVTGMVGWSSTSAAKVTLSGGAQG